MGKKKGKNGNGTNKPQSINQPVNLTVFQPFRRLLVATEAAVTSAAPVAQLQFNSLTPPATALAATSAFVNTFDATRVMFIDIFFDQRGAGSTAAVPRSSAWIGEQGAAVYDETKLINIARFAGSGMDQVVPGKRYRVTVGPKYSAGRFDTSNSNTLFLVTKDYVGTIRLETCFEAYGPPLDYRVTPVAHGVTGSVPATVGLPIM